jgi:hypothetical protein
MLHRIMAILFLAGTAATLAAQSSVSFETYGVSQTPDYDGGFLPGIVAGDFNNDGKPDIVQCCNSNEQIMFLAGNGDGTFKVPAIAWATQVDAPQLIAADVNGDGKLDLIGVAAVNPASPPAASAYSLVVWLGNGDGTFQAPQTYSLGSQTAAGSVVVGNFFGDGHPDVAVGLGGGQIDLFRNEGDGAFVFEKSISVPGATDAQSPIAAGDLNGTGVADLAIVVSTGTTSSGSTGVTTEVDIFWNDGKGDFTQDKVGTYTYQQSLTELTIARLNGTAQMDLLASYQCPPTGDASYCFGIDGYYGQGNNTVYKRTLVTDSSGVYPGYYSSPLFGVDVNGDGYGDLVMVGGLQCGSSGCGQSSEEGAFVWLGNADGSFQQTAQTFFTQNLDNTGPAVMADFARNGMMDFAQPSVSPSFLEVYLNATQRPTCGTYTISPTATECQPVDNTYSPSPVRVEANTYDTSKVTAMQEYIDGSLEYSEPVTGFNETFPVDTGSHLFVTKAWDQSGRSFEAERTVTVFDGTPGPVCAAATDSAAICLPAGDTSSSPVEILANGDTGTSVATAAQLYIDGKLVVNSEATCEYGGCYAADSYVQTTQDLPAGTHLLVFKIWDAAGSVHEAQKTITVD